MELLEVFIAICMLGLVLHIAYWIYLKVEKIIKQHRKLFFVILISCYTVWGTGSAILDMLNIKNIFIVILLSSIGIFAFLLTFCLIFSLNKTEN